MSITTYDRRKFYENVECPDRWMYHAVHVCRHVGSSCAEAVMNGKCFHGKKIYRAKRAVPLLTNTERLHDLERRVKNLELLK